MNNAPGPGPSVFTRFHPASTVAFFTPRPTLPLFGQRVLPPSQTDSLEELTWKMLTISFLAYEGVSLAVATGAIPTNVTEHQIELQAFRKMPTWEYAEYQRWKKGREVILPFNKVTSRRHRQDWPHGERDLMIWREAFRIMMNDKTITDEHACWLWFNMGNVKHLMSALTQVVLAFIEVGYLNYKAADLSEEHRLVERRVANQISNDSLTRLRVLSENNRINQAATEKASNMIITKVMELFQ
jgi:hypothetical protein